MSPVMKAPPGLTLKEPESDDSHLEMVAYHSLTFGTLFTEDAPNVVYYTEEEEEEEYDSDYSYDSNYQLYICGDADEEEWREDVTPNADYYTEMSGHYIAEDKDTDSGNSSEYDQFDTVIILDDDADIIEADGYYPPVKFYVWEGWLGKNNEPAPEGKRPPPGLTVAEEAQPPLKTSLGWKRPSSLNLLTADDPHTVQQCNVTSNNTPADVSSPPSLTIMEEAECHTSASSNSTSDAVSRPKSHIRSWMDRKLGRRMTADSDCSQERPRNNLLQWIRSKLCLTSRRST